jgi:hypothetical protein
MKWARHVECISNIGGNRPRRKHEYEWKDNINMDVKGIV